jgi:hypothetical protein
MLRLMFFLKRSGVRRFLISLGLVDITSSFYWQYDFPHHSGRDVPLPRPWCNHGAMCFLHLCINPHAGNENTIKILLILSFILLLNALCFLTVGFVIFGLRIRRATPPGQSFCCHNKPTSQI